jgi:hypothetical protein
VGRRRRQEKGVRGGIRFIKCVHMYVSAKVIPVETIPGMGGGGIKKNRGRMNSSMIYLIHCKNFCKCHSVPTPRTQKKK